jgi:hypothetical protein
MAMFTQVAVLLIALGSDGSGTAQALAVGAGSDEEYEHLVPEDGVLLEPGFSYHYQEALLAFLLAGFDVNRQCQMVVEDSAWSTNGEFGVFILRDGRSGRSTVVRRYAKKSISQAVSAAMSDKNRPEGSSYWPYLKMKTSDLGEERVPLSEATAEAMLQACEMMMSTVKYPTKPRLLLHPTAVHFAHHDVNHGYRVGKTIFNKGRVGRFRRLLEQLGEVATSAASTRSAAEKKLRDAAMALVAELSAVGVPIPDIKEEMRVPPPLDGK